MDSCASADNEMINRLWRGRRRLFTAAFATGRVPGRLVVRLMRWLQHVRRRVRGGGIHP
jgi:hypothetical protein